MRAQLIWLGVVLVAVYVAFAGFRHLAHRTECHHLDMKLGLVGLLFFAAGIALSAFDFWAAALPALLTGVYLVFAGVFTTPHHRSGKGFPSALSG